MIELRNKESFTSHLGNEINCYEIFIDNELISEINAGKSESKEIDIELDREFSFKQLLNKVGKCNVNSLVFYEKKSQSFIIFKYGDVHYNWEKIFFKSLQKVWIKSTTEVYEIGIKFHFSYEFDASNWTYKYSPTYVLEQFPLISHSKIDITSETETVGESFFLVIKLKKEFITTLSYSYNELIKAIYEVEQELYERLEGVNNKNTDMSKNKSTVFISYSHKDSKWLKEMKRHFKPLENEVEFWDDTKILPGQEWRDEVEKALSRAKIGILMLSVDFFNSDFILKNELPPLLAAAEEKGTVILSVVLRPCRFDSYPEISKYQFVNSPDKTLSEMEEYEIENVFIKLIDTIETILETKSKNL